MGLIDTLAKRNRQKEGAGLPAPQSGAKRYFFLLGTHFWKFIKLNLMFIALSLPVVTLPASLSAMNRVCVKLVRDGNCFLWDDFGEEFKKSFLRSLPLGLLCGAGLALGYYFISLGLSNPMNIYGILLFAAGLFLAGFTLLRGSWIFVLLSMLDQNNRAILKNARILMAVETKRSLWMLAALAAALALLLLLFPFSLIPAVLILFSLLQYTLCFFVNPAVQTRILDPYEMQQQEAMTACQNKDP